MRYHFFLFRGEDIVATLKLILLGSKLILS